MNQHTERFLDAMKVIANAKPAGNFDRTVKVLITEVADPANKKYNVEYDGITYKDIFGNDNFEIGDYVYMRLIGGQLDGEKILERLAVPLDIPAAAILPVETATSQIYRFSEEYGIYAGQHLDNQNNYIELSIDEGLLEDFNVQSIGQKYLKISADFKVEFNIQFDISKNTYGIQLVYKNKNDNSERVDEFSSSEFIGNSLLFSSWTPQDKIFYFNNFFENYTLEAVRFYENFEKHDVLNGENIEVPNIFLQNFSLQFIEVEDLSQEERAIRINANQGRLLKDDSSITLEAKIYEYGFLLKDPGTIYWQELNEKFEWVQIQEIENSILTINSQNKSHAYYRAYMGETEETYIFSTPIEIINPKLITDIVIEQQDQYSEVSGNYSGSNFTLSNGSGYWAYSNEGDFSNIVSLENEEPIQKIENITTNLTGLIKPTIYSYYKNNSNYYLLSKEYIPPKIETITITNNSYMFPGATIIKYEANATLGSANQIYSIIPSQSILRQDIINGKITGVKWEFTADSLLGTDEENVSKLVEDVTFTWSWKVPESITENIILEYNGVEDNNTDYTFNQPKGGLFDVFIPSDNGVLQFRPKTNYTFPQAQNNKLYFYVERKDQEPIKYEYEVHFLADGNLGTNGTKYALIIEDYWDDATKPWINSQNWNGLKLVSRIFNTETNEEVNTASWSWTSGMNPAWNSNEQTILGSSIIEVPGDRSGAALENITEYIELKATLNNGIILTSTYTLSYVQSNWFTGDNPKITNIIFPTKTLQFSVNKQTVLSENNKFIIEGYGLVQENGIDPLISIGIKDNKYFSITHFKTEQLDDNKNRIIYLLQPNQNYLNNYTVEEIETPIIYTKFNWNYNQTKGCSHVIAIFINRYENTLINNWNGETLSSSDGILAPLVAAGQKNNDNTFSGVMMGKDKDKLGLFGYKDGAKTFSIDTNGDAVFKGEIRATKGYIGNSTINNTDGWEIASNIIKYISSQKNDEKQYVFGLQTKDVGNGTSTNALAIGLCVDPINSWMDAPFRVTHTGELYATSADIKGNVIAESGKIAKWRINDYTIENIGISSVIEYASVGMAPGVIIQSNGSLAMPEHDENNPITTKSRLCYWAGASGGWLYESSNQTDYDKYYFPGGRIFYDIKEEDGTISRKAWGIKINEAPFRVYADGSLYASKADITGAINVTEGGSLGKWTIDPFYGTQRNQSAIYNAQKIGDYTYRTVMKTSDGSWGNEGVFGINKLDADGNYISTPFMVDYNGILRATEVIITGSSTKTNTTTRSSNICSTTLTTSNSAYGDEGGNTWYPSYLDITSKNNSSIATRILVAPYYMNLESKTEAGEVSSITFNSEENTIMEQYALNLSSSSGKLNGTWYGTSTESILSDINKKNTISTLSPQHSTFFDNLHPVTYKYNDGTSDRLHTGFIAQEVCDALEIAEIDTQDFAGLVIHHDEKSNDTWYLRYEEFIALNTSEIQKAKARTAILEQEVEELKAKINQLI